MIPSKGAVKEEKNAPNGPVTVIVFLTTGLYEVALRTALGSPMTTSTPGGTDSGVRPSFDRAAGVVENGLDDDDCVAEGNRRPVDDAENTEDAGRSAERGIGQAAAAADSAALLPPLRQGAMSPAIAGILREPPGLLFA
ncbi:hypothetical protein MKX07_003449 [Trichoderma sp. CBMAI-0711]|nr:hypothetical protein MKX07_003449 [Trichoderma sp. CBMAI-0711]